MIQIKSPQDSRAKRLQRFLSVVQQSCRLGIALLFLAAIPPTSLIAQQYAAEKPMGAAAQSMPEYLKHAGIEQRLNSTLPLATSFLDESGKPASLSTFFGKQPVILVPMYYRCTILCPQVLQGLTKGLRQTTLIPGRDYQIVIFSIDPADTPADARAEKQHFLEMLGNSQGSAAIHFLTGQQQAIESITAATGFHYVRVPGPDGKINQFAHSSVIMFVTPDGRLSKYLSGIQYDPRDLRLALLDASKRKISNPVDLFLLYCCSYNPAAGKYTVSILRLLGIAALLTLAGMGCMFYFLTRNSAKAT